MRCLLFTASLLALPSLTWAANVDVLEEVIVTATLRAQPLVDVLNSVTVLETQTLKDAGQQHFQDVLGLVPNLNWAGGTSRPRFFQIRGIGEREQYEGAPNPSVGLLIDDIDFSGLGMPATLFDVKQIEVLRGPQGTRYGANALAGLIAVRGNDPEQEAHHGVEASVGNYGTRSLGITATAPVESLNSAWRLSVQQYRSDGFRSNPYLNRKDTDGRDELTGRFKWRWQVDDDATLDLTLLHANLDNGYDGWSIDNSRVSLSDKPGKDSQRATGVSARLTAPFMSSLHTTVIASYLKSDSINSFDADWGNSTSWRPYVYDYFMSSDRERINRSLEVRLASDELSDDQPLAWLVGAYVLRMNEQGGDELWGRYADPGDPVYADRDSLHTDYQATNLALFGQLDGYLAPRWRWSAGLRGEQRQAVYQDQNGISLQANDLSARDRMLGGQLSLSREMNEQASTYVSVSRGYKAGGFNLGASIASTQRYFAPEYLWSAETGFKAVMLEGRLFVDAAAFYQWRRNLQLRSGEQADITNPGTYIFITSNAARGYNSGAEFSARYALTPAWQAGGTLGLLRSQVSGMLDDNGDVVPARAQAHAPEYTASVFALWRAASGLMARLDVSARDNFYFDVPTDHNQQSRAYSITNVKLGYEQPVWSAHLWISNVFNKDYDIRGFYFSNEPPDWETKLYTQKGEPRTVGVTASLKF